MQKKCQLQRKRKPGGETPTDESEDEADDNSLYSVLACKCCTRLWQRDVNAPRNMHLIADHPIDGRERPEAYRRPKPKSVPVTKTG
jgi:hypothetical protein